MSEDGAGASRRGASLLERARPARGSVGPTTIPPTYGPGVAFRGPPAGWSVSRTVPSALGGAQVRRIQPPWSTRVLDRPVFGWAGAGSKIVTPGLSWSATSTLDTGKSIGALIPCFNNAWWCASAPAYPDGLAVFQDASQTVYLIDIANPTTPIYTSSSPGGTPPYASVAVSRDGTRIVVAYVSGSDSVVVVTSDDAFGSEATVSEGRHQGCANPVVVLSPTGGFHVVYTAWEDRSTRQVHVYKVSEASEYQPVQWDEPADTVTSAAFPSVAISGDEDANGDGAMALVVWQSTAGDLVKNIRGRGCDSGWFSKSSGASEGEPRPFGDFDTRDVALTASASPDESRDPCVFCTAEGEFFIGYTEDVSGGQVVVKRCGDPMHGGLAGLAAVAPVRVVAPGGGEVQNFLNGWVDAASGFAIVVWEQSPSRRDPGYKWAQGAYVDLSDTTGTWVDVGQVSDTDKSVEEAANPSVWLTATGEVFLTCVQSDGATGGAVVFEARRGVLT